MRNPLKESIKTQARPKTIKAPLGGWNTRDPLANMPESDAIVLDNWFPGTKDVQIRLGYQTHATTPDGIQIKSFLPYISQSGVAKLFVGTNNGIYEVTSAGFLNSVVASGSTNGYWQSVNLSNAAGNFLWCCNGTDKSCYYDGTHWVILTDTETIGASALWDTAEFDVDVHAGGITPPLITGLPSVDIINVSLFKSRLYAVRKNSLSFYYLGVNSIQGAFTEYPLGAIFKRGGYIVAIDSWTLDAGDGSDDRFVVVTSEGEVAIYIGTNPANAATWALAGVYYLGQPMGYKCTCRISGDLCIATSSGMVPLSRVLLSSLVSKKATLSDKIDSTFSEYASMYGVLQGWQPILFPEMGMFLVNVPISTLYSYQLVMNTQTGAWCRFTGMDASCWVVFEGGLYFAQNNKVYKAWQGYSDDGNAIHSRAKTAYTALGSRGQNKKVNLIRPIFSTNKESTYSLAIDNDYIETLQTSLIQGSSASGATWNVSTWDNAQWVGATTSAQWRSAPNTLGNVKSLRLDFSLVDTNLTWIATDYILEDGGIF